MTSLNHLVMNAICYHRTHSDNKAGETFDNSNLKESSLYIKIDCWYEETLNILQAVHGDKKASKMIQYYKPPRELYQ